MEQHELFDGFELAGCAIRRRNIIAFWGQRWDNSDPFEVRVSRMYFYNPDRAEADRWAYREISEAMGLRTCAVTLPAERWIFVMDDGAVYVVGQGDDAFENDIVSRPYYFFSNVKCIPPGRACAVGPNRKVYVRDAPDSWRHLAAGLLPTGEQTELAVSGFADIDGFGEDDLYACGEHGDLWHYNGSLWTPVQVPTNESLERLCCASNGLVYVITDGRKLLVGRNQSWAMIEQDLTNSRFESIVEFGGQVIFSTESALFEVVDGTIRPASLGTMPQMRSCSFLASGDGILVVCGSTDASMFDGTNWSVILK